MDAQELDARLDAIYETVAYDEKPDYQEALRRLNQAAGLVIGLRETLHAERTAR